MFLIHKWQHIKGYQSFIYLHVDRLTTINLLKFYVDKFTDDHSFDKDIKKWYKHVSYT